MSHVVSSETGMVVQRLMKLSKGDGKLMIHVRWRSLPESKDTLEPLHQVYDDVPTLLLKLIARKNTPANLTLCTGDELSKSA